jgi:hypothetical protein
VLPRSSAGTTPTRRQAASIKQEQLQADPAVLQHQLQQLQALLQPLKQEPQQTQQQTGPAVVSTVASALQGTLPALQPAAQQQPAGITLPVPQLAPGQDLLVQALLAQLQQAPTPKTAAAAAAQVPCIPALQLPGLPAISSTQLTALAPGALPAVGAWPQLLLSGTTAAGAPPGRTAGQGSAAQAMGTTARPSIGLNLGEPPAGTTAGPSTTAAGAALVEASGGTPGHAAQAPLHRQQLLTRSHMHPWGSPLP